MSDQAETPVFSPDEAPQEPEAVETGPEAPTQPEQIQALANRYLTMIEHFARSCRENGALANHWGTLSVSASSLQKFIAGKAMPSERQQLTVKANNHGRMAHGALQNMLSTAEALRALLAPAQNPIDKPRAAGPASKLVGANGNPVGR